MSHTLSNSPSPSPSPSPRPCGMELLGGYRFLPMGVTRFGVLIADPQAALPDLPGTHLYYPVECVINARENTQFGLIKVRGPDGGPSPCVVVREDGTPCHQFHPGVFDGPEWDALRQHTNAYLQAFGVTTPLTSGSMYAQLAADLIASLGASQSEIDAGQWWLTTPLTTTGLQPMFFLMDLGGNQLGNPVQPMNKAPITHGQMVPGPAQQANVRQFEKYEAELMLDNDYFHHADKMNKNARFDAYDADHDGERIIVDARFTLRDGNDPNGVVAVDGVPQVFDVPCFCMKDTATGPFRWKVRFAPPRPTTGTQVWELTSRAAVWHVAKGDTPTNVDEYNQLTVPGGANNLKAYYHYWGYNEFTDPQAPQALAAPGNHHQDPKLDKPKDPILPIPLTRVRVDAGQKDGPLRVNPAGGLYLQQLTQASGYAPQPFFILGAVTPWANAAGATAIDRNNDLLAPMAAAKLNFNYTWMAPWETMLTRTAQSEDWYIGPQDPANLAGPTSQPIAVGGDQGWRAYSYYDQGRADRLDKIVEAHEANNVYNALVIWPHDSLRAAGHGWGAGAWGENGLSSTMTIDEFFGSAAQDASTNWLWQKDLYRYIVARYGYSRTVALWFTIAELEGVGNQDTYWFTTPSTKTWHDKMLTTLQALDYRRRPITTTTTYFQDDQTDPYNGATEIAGHGDFQGGNPKVDILGFDAYPKVWSENGNSMKVNDPTFPTFCRTSLRAQQARQWHYGVARMYSWVKGTPGLSQPHLITEFGLAECLTASPRAATDPVLENQVRSYMHFVTWAAFANAHAGTPLKWCDQGQFGSLFPHGGGAFANPYPNFAVEIQPLANLLSPTGPLSDFGRLSARILGITASTQLQTNPIRAFGLVAEQSPKDLAVVWLFDDIVGSNQLTRDYVWTDGNGNAHKDVNNPDRRATEMLNIPGLEPGRTYVVSRYNTWDGGTASTDGPFTTDVAGKLSLRVGKFSESARTPKVWDGADVLLIIRLQP